MLASPTHGVVYAQNFLRDPRLVERLLDRSSIGRDDLVLEIGPGHGIITAALAERCRGVVAVEKDPALARRLGARFAHAPHVSVRAGDFLHAPLPSAAYKVFANVPFNITAEIVQRLTEAHRTPEDCYLAVQKEAAERFLGQPHESLRAVLLKPWFEPTLVHRFRRADFVPAPQVEVVMLRLRKRGPPLLAPSEAQSFRDFVVYLFTAWKPSACATLKGILGPRQRQELSRRSGCQIDIPPTAVSFEQWLALFAAFSAVAHAPAWHAIRGSEARLQEQQARLHKVHRTRRTPYRRGEGRVRRS